MSAEPVSAVPERPSLRERGRLRRRLRYLERLREVQLRDLGGLVLELRRAAREQPALLEAKIAALEATDSELRGLEGLLGEHREVREIREPGLGGACPRCGRIHGSADSFCAHCGQELAA